ncbi:YkvI family membrane protein [Lentibacillus jeotgali]|uniref:YkvI family membrane protein n=1 Tax=Lentibacillus jeotgali TaxID=558169 RepID=UPI000494CB75|nr:membrane protein [Lentibacillus jeotgali]
MKKILKIGSAFIGIIVGAGLASGQEILQYFTSFGLWGIVGAVVTTALFAYVGMMLVWLGSRAKQPSHKEVIYGVSGRFLGLIIDYILIFTLFGVGVVMIAGAGSNLNQQFGIPIIAGTTLISILVIVTGMLRVDRVVNIISGITPFLIIFVVIVSIYSFLTMDDSYLNLDSIARGHPTSLPNWFISAINYVSFNTAVGASMAIVTGAAETDRKTAAWGGLAGGIGLGLIILLSHLAIFAKIEEVGSLELPTLGIVNDISPFLGVLMSLVLFAMIFNTAISMFYSFGARFTEPGTKTFKLFFTITVVVGYATSFVGFTDLVSSLYPFIGYLGLVLIIVLFIAPFRVKKWAEDV